MPSMSSRDALESCKVRSRQRGESCCDSIPPPHDPCFTLPPPIVIDGRSSDATRSHPSLSA